MYKHNNWILILHFWKEITSTVQFSLSHPTIRPKETWRQMQYKVSLGSIPSSTASIWIGINTASFVLIFLFFDFELSMWVLNVSLGITTENVELISLMFVSNKLMQLSVIGYFMWVFLSFCLAWMRVCTDLYSNRNIKRT